MPFLPLDTDERKLRPTSCTETIGRDMLEGVWAEVEIVP
jgi:hypothetical protein